MAICRTIIGCVAIHFALTVAAVAGEATYTYYDLGSLGLPVYNLAYDINDLGIVGGASRRSHEVFVSAYTWKNGVMTDHTDSIPGGWFGAISGISEVGPMSGGASGDERAVLWRDGVGYYPDVPDGCQANEGVLGINAAGTLAVGQCEVEDGYNNMPALYFVDSGSGLALGFLPDTPEDTEAWALDVNDSGIVVGWAMDGRAFWWQDGQMEEIPNLLGGTVITAWAINNAGLVVGNASNTPNGNVATSYDLNTGIMTCLGLGTPEDVNEHGHAVGSSGSHAMLYKNGEVIDLHELILDEFLEYSDANAINNYGWIVGDGEDCDNHDRGWLLVPNHPKGDFDGDGDVDLQDSGHFQRCFAAPPYIDGTLHVGCSVFDFDNDVDLDLDDYSAFQGVFTGPND